MARAPGESYRVEIAFGGGYIPGMAAVSMNEAQNRLPELAQRAEQGERIVLTRDGKPVLDLVPHRGGRGIDFDAGRSFLKSLDIDDPFPDVSEDFDLPLAEDFLTKPLPPD